MSLQGRRIVVTGASSGIGRALCVAYADSGARVWGVGRDTDRLQEVVAATTGSVTPLSVDLVEPDGPAAVAASVSPEAVDVVVHAAGTLGPPSTTLADYPDDAWDAVLAVNLTAVQRLHRALAPALDAGSDPAVIAVSSGVGRATRPGWGAYSIAKHAVEAWAAILAEEWSGRVYSVNPGATRTPMRAAAVPDEDPSTLPTPEDIAPIFLHLAHPSTPEPSGALLDARDWIGRDPWEGLP